MHRASVPIVSDRDSRDDSGARRRRCEDVQSKHTARIPAYRRWKLEGKNCVNSLSLDVRTSSRRAGIMACREGLCVINAMRV